MEYIKIENGKVTGHFSAKKIPEGKEYKEVENFNSTVGIDVNFLNDDGSLKSNETLISEGLVEDCRGAYYHKETKFEIVIDKIGVDIPDCWTKEKPSGMPYQKWNGEKWEDDKIKKEEYEKNIKIENAKGYLFSTDYKVIKALESGVSIKELYPGELEKREEAREIIRSLTN